MQDFSFLPQIDKILSFDEFKNYNKAVLTRISRQTLENLRKNPQNLSINKDEIYTLIKEKYEEFLQNSLQPLINATGIVCHTNFGRSVIDESILNSTKDIICSYCNLEYDLKNASRSNRYNAIGFLLSTLFNCEDALVVNNNAAAVFLVLNTFAKNAKTIVSRGELVEIGGNFRVPEVMKESGTNLVEIGTTNKTHLSDYENAICDETKMILKVHKSNFSMLGFTQEVEISKLASLAKKYNILSYYDLGAGTAINLKNFSTEKSVQTILKSGVDLLSFSGDKIFGSVQAGIILGKKDLITKLRQNQLLRMLRVDKISLALLCQSINAYLQKDYEKLPTIYLLEQSLQELENFANEINSKLTIKAQIIKTSTFAGGGALPNKQIPSLALTFLQNAKILEEKFRKKGVIGRIENDKFLLDLRSVLKTDKNKLINIINEILG